MGCGKKSVASLLWQEPEEELIILLLMKVSDRDQNVKGKMLVVIVNSIFLKYVVVSVINEYLQMSI